MSDFPDYEAAAKELHEQSADQSDTFDAAKAIVDAALGDKKLWVTVESTEDCAYCHMTWSWCDLNGGDCCINCPHYARAQVWPKEAADE